MVVYEDEMTGLVCDMRKHATITVQGLPSVIRTILKIWTCTSNLRKLAEFSRTWLGPDEEPETRRRINADVYLYQLQSWCEANKHDASMGFPYPWDPSLCDCVSSLNRHFLFKNIEQYKEETQPVPSSSELHYPVEPSPTPSCEEPDVPSMDEHNTTSSRDKTPDSSPSGSEAPTDPEQHLLGTDLALSIHHNLLMQAKYDGDGISFLEFCDHEVRKVMQAPSEISEAILHPAYRPDNPNRHPGQGTRRYPSNPHNTMRALPTLGPVAPFSTSRSCNRCEKVNTVHSDLGLRPVTNLTRSSWEGLPEQPTEWSRTHPFQVEQPTEERRAYLCSGCVFPACAQNQGVQELEYRHGQFQATKATRDVPPPPVSEIAESVEPEQGPAWGDSSDDSEYIPLNRRRKSPAVPTPATPQTLLATASAQAKDLRSVQFDTPGGVIGPGKAWSTSTGYTADRPTSKFNTYKEMDAKYKITDNVDKTWT